MAFWDFQDRLAKNPPPPNQFWQDVQQIHENAPQPTPGGSWWDQNKPPVSSSGPVDSAPGPGTPTSPGGGGNYQQQVQALLQGLDASPGGWQNSLNSIAAKLEAMGIKVQRDSAGNVRGRLFLPNGETVDVSQPENNRWVWISRGTGGGEGGGGGAAPGAGFGSEQWNGLSAADFRSSPGYEFAMKQGLQGIERGAASKGTLLTGGTLKSLTGYATGLADQDYGNAFNRALQTHQTRYSDLYNIANLGKPQ